MLKQFNAPDGDSCKEVSYEYDALNFRTKRTSVLEGTVTEYAYGRNGALTYEKFTKNGTTVGSRTYAYLNDQIIGFTDTDGTVESKRYVVTDIQGSVNEIYDESGNLIWKSGYTAFGELAGESVDKLEGVFEFHGMYTGCQIDAETGLTYHWNRWRSEDGANFITPDPVRDGSNWFGYAGQNPVNNVDPNGLAFYGPDGVHSITDTPYVAKDVVRNTETPQGATGTVETTDINVTKDISYNSNDLSSKLNINNKYQLNKGTKNRPGTKILKTKGIVIHWTGVKKQSAKTTIDYWRKNKSYNSAHYVIDINGEIFSAVPVDEVAWHSGQTIMNGELVYAYTDKALSILEGTTENDSINNYLIGIELEPLTDKLGTGEFSLATNEAAIKLTAALLMINNLNPDTNLYRHYDLTTKPCPLFYTNDSNWNIFVNNVKNEMEKMGGVGYEY